MQFIDKTLHRNEGHALVRKFIERQWIDEQQYLNLNYQDFKYKNDPFVNLLVDEQRGYCCYCMRKLSTDKDNKNVTLEHVIPQTATSFMDYEGYGELTPQNIFFWDSSLRTAKFKSPPFPHFIAYENLVASCNGAIVEYSEARLTHQQCCNNRRANDPIIPVFFLQNVSEIFNYASDGKIICDEKYDQTIRTLNLEHDQLCLARKVWCSLSPLYNLIDILIAITDVDFRKDILLDTDLSSKERQSLELDVYWKLIVQFEWFYNYYSVRLQKA